MTPVDRKMSGQTRPFTLHCSLIRKRLVSLRQNAPSREFFSSLPNPDYMRIAHQVLLIEKHPSKFRAIQYKLLFLCKNRKKTEGSSGKFSRSCITFETDARSDSPIRSPKASEHPHGALPSPACGRGWGRGSAAQSSPAAPRKPLAQERPEAAFPRGSVGTINGPSARWAQVPAAPLSH